jgi:hypothetical protein
MSKDSSIGGGGPIDHDERSDSGDSPITRGRIAVVGGVAVVVLLAVTGVLPVQLGDITGGGSSGVDIDNVEAPGSVGEGQSFAVTVTVNNTANQTVTDTVDVDIDGIGNDTAEVTVPAERTSTERFEFETQTGDAGEYNISVISGDDSREEPISVVAGAPELGVDITDTTSPVLAGSPLDVTATVGNNEGTAWSGDVVLNNVSGGTVDTVAVEIPADESEEVELVWNTEPEQPITGNITVRARDDRAGTVASADESVEVRQSGEPNFEVTAVEAPDEVTAGEEFDVTVTVENTGSSASREITVAAGALGSETGELSLFAGDSTDATFTFDTSGPGAGTYEITASGDTDGTATVTVSEPASLSGLDIEGEGADATVPRGEDATVEVQLTNDGEQSKAFEAALSVDGSRQQTASTGTLEPGETGTASFELSGDREPGTYGITVSVTGQAVTGTVEIAGTAVSSLSGLDIAEDGTEATITQTAERGVAVTVENRGGLADNFGVSLKIGDGLVERGETFTDDLTPGASETITFDAVTGSLDPGEYDVTVNTSDDTTTGTLTVEQPSREFFSVSSLSVQQKRATGESIEPTAEIENVGTESGTQSVTLTVYLQGEVQQTDRAENITLAGGASTTVEFSSFEVSRGGNYGIFVETANDSAQQNIPVREEQAFFNVTTLGASSQVAEGGEISVTARITNTGGGTDSQTVEVTTNPSIGSDQTTVKLDADESTTEEFTIETSDNDAGDYNITLSSEDDTDSERVTVTTDGFLNVSIQGTNSPTVGNDIEVTARITNTGGATASQTVEATTSIRSDQTTVELAAGASTTKTFSIGTEDGDSGEYDVTVSSDDSSASETVTVVGVFTVEITSIKSPVVAGDPVIVGVNVSNTGTVETTKALTLDVGVLGSTSTDVTLAGRDSKRLSLTLETKEGDAGSYTATVSTIESSNSRDVTVTEPSALSAPSTTGRSADAMRLRDTGTDAPGWASARATDAPKTLEPIAGAYGW